MLFFKIEDADYKGNKKYGGESGIRTHGGGDPSAVFKTATLNHSIISPVQYNWISDALKCNTHHSLTIQPKNEFSNQSHANPVKNTFHQTALFRNPPAEKVPSCTQTAEKNSFLFDN